MTPRFDRLVLSLSLGIALSGAADVGQVDGTSRASIDIVHGGVGKEVRAVQELAILSSATINQNGASKRADTSQAGCSTSFSSTRPAAASRCASCGNGGARIPIV